MRCFGPLGYGQPCRPSDESRHLPGSLSTELFVVSALSRRKERVGLQGTFWLAIRKDAGVACDDAVPCFGLSVRECEPPGGFFVAVLPKLRSHFGVNARLLSDWQRRVIPCGPIAPHRFRHPVQRLSGVVRSEIGAMAEHGTVVHQIAL